MNYICKYCYYQIRNIGPICKYINDETCKILVQALIISRLDYGNPLLYNIPLSLTNRKSEHIKPVLFQLNWLPVRFRSLYKLLFLTFKVMNGTAPVYLSDQIGKKIPVRMLRYESYSLLREPRSHTAMH